MCVFYVNSLMFNEKWKANEGLYKGLLCTQPCAQCVEGLQNVGKGLCLLKVYNLAEETRFMHMKQLGNTRHGVIMPSCIV